MSDKLPSMKKESGDSVDSVIHCAPHLPFLKSNPPNS